MHTKMMSLEKIKAAKLEVEREKKIEKELAACSFKPEIHSVNAKIMKRIPTIKETYEKLSPKKKAEKMQKRYVTETKQSFEEPDDA